MRRSVLLIATISVIVSLVISVVAIVDARDQFENGIEALADGESGHSGPWYETMGYCPGTSIVIKCTAHVTPDVCIESRAVCHTLTW